ncbi:MAG: asparaginase [Actinomycetaceae bacterium]|nr:asparaginase [Actinomycetaceae bacterium]
MTLPRIAVAALGGTIGMRQAHSGEPVVPKLTAADLLAEIPQINSVAEIEATTVTSAPSPSLTLNELVAAHRWARERVQAGARGVVLTHGTDTLEESAFFLDLLWDRPEPLVLTGAMRSGDLLGADGAANLHDSIVCAASDDARNWGVLACLNQQVHLALTVAKEDSHALEAFTSAGFGPLGYVREGSFENRWGTVTQAGRQRPQFAPPANTHLCIPIVEAAFDERGEILDAIDGDRFPAVVVNGSGVGHVSASMADRLETLVKRDIPVLVASRTSQSGTARALYGYAGAEADLLRRGIILTGQLSARKSRLALFLMMDAGFSLTQIRQQFQKYWRGQ